MTDKQEIIIKDDPRDMLAMYWSRRLAEIIRSGKTIDPKEQELFLKAVKADAIGNNAGGGFDDENLVPGHPPSLAFQSNWSRDRAAGISKPNGTTTKTNGVAGTKNGNGVA